MECKIYNFCAELQTFLKRQARITENLKAQFNYLALLYQDDLLKLCIIK